MSSIGDSSHISDLSAISHISRSSGVRRSAKPRSDLDASERRASSTTREQTSGIAAQFAGASRLPRIVKVLELCEEASGNNAKLELLYQCARFVAEKRRDEPIFDKLRNILSRHEAAKYLRLPDEKKIADSEITLLGIVSDSKKPQMSLAEKREISARVEDNYRERMNRFIDSYEKLGGKVEEVLRSQESAGKACLSDNHETDLMRWNDPTNEICTEYYRDLLTCADLLCQWRRLKYIEMRELNAKNADNLLLQAQVAETQAAISTRTCASMMFNETPFTAKALGALSDSLHHKILEMREEIKRKETSRITYTDAASKEYDQLLRRYTELGNAIRKKERLMEML